MPYILEPMQQQDIPAVARIERLCFSMPWPTSAYRRELKMPESNRYIVVRYISPEDARHLGLSLPTQENLTSLAHPELPGVEANNHQPKEQNHRSLLESLLSWRRNGNSGQLPVVDSSPFPIVGYAGLWLMVDEAHVTTIGVHPDHRGQGAGELLFLGLIDIGQHMRAVRITLEVRVSNSGAQALYRKYGLEIAGVRRRYYSDNGEDAYIMWSEPLASPRFQQRAATLRANLANRLRESFYQPAAPTRPIDRSRLQ